MSVDGCFLFQLLVFKTDIEIERTVSSMDTEDTLKCCSCGRNQKTRVKSCSSRLCPCVAAEHKCTAGCKCIGCVNRIAAKDSVCRCGEGKRNDFTFTSCHDKPGQRKTKCPCFSQGRACTNKCRCFHCENDFGTRDAVSIKKRRAEKITSSSPSCKRKPCHEYLDSAGATMEFGSWTKMETCILSTTESYIAGIAPTTENIQKLYNYVIKGVTSQEGIGLTKTKSLNQVRAKLLHKKKREEALRGFLSAVTYTAE